MCGFGGFMRYVFDAASIAYELYVPRRGKHIEEIRKILTGIMDNNKEVR